MRALFDVTYFTGLAVMFLYYFKLLPPTQQAEDVPHESPGQESAENKKARRQRKRSEFEALNV